MPHGPAPRAPRFARTGRLHWRIWLAVVASLAVFAVLVGSAWKLFSERPYSTQQRVFAELAAGALPGPDANSGEVQAALEHWKARLNSDLALFGRDGTALGATAPDMPAPPVNQPDDDWVVNARGPALAMRLPDGRFLLARRLHGSHRAPLGTLGMLALIAVAVGVGTYPVVRRLTRRLERLQASVERLGSGDLSARVQVHGHDEVAKLAASFNDAAARIEQLVKSHRLLLANASHELRSPLARVRMAMEMMQSAPRDSAQAASLQAEVRRDIGELDGLIDEILLASRLDATDPRDGFASLDFAALCAEECARNGSAFEARNETAKAEPYTLRGDARLLRRALRNLIENAQRYGAGTPIELLLVRDAAGLLLNVCDRGPGVAQSERERIFEPFYRPPGTPEASGGVGLGLALVRKIVQQHDGQVVCRGRQGGGSCFEVRLPQVTAA